MKYEKPQRPNAPSGSPKFEKKSGFEIKKRNNDSYDAERPFREEKPTFIKKRSEQNDFEQRPSREQSGGFFRRKSEGEGYERPETKVPSYIKKRSEQSSNDRRPSRREDEGFFVRKENGELDRPKTSNSFFQKKSEGFKKRNDDFEEEKPRFEKRSSSKEYGDRPSKTSGFSKRDSGSSYKKYNSTPKYDEPKNDSGEIRLNRYIANSGVCSRREADTLIEQGQISINGTVCTVLGTKVKPGDVVRYKGRTLQAEKFVYVLLNKPKDYITTTDDPEGRRTVMELVQGTGASRIYPVGRLDRNTTGLLVMTNDGEFAKKLSHPSGKVHKIYMVELDKPISTRDFDAIKFKEFELEDGPIELDGLSIVGDDRKTLGVELHSGRNRIVRRIFEHLGYNVVRLDRTVYGGLTKQDLPRGNWRFLHPMEVNQLKKFNKVKEQKEESYS